MYHSDPSHRQGPIAGIVVAKYDLRVSSIGITLFSAREIATLIGTADGECPVRTLFSSRGDRYMGYAVYRPSSVRGLYPYHEG